MHAQCLIQMMHKGAVRVHPAIILTPQALTQITDEFLTLYKGVQVHGIPCNGPSQKHTPLNSQYVGPWTFCGQSSTPLYVRMDHRLTQ